MKKLFCLLLVLALLCASLPAFAAETAALGQPFEDFTVTTIDGEEFSLSKALAEYEAVYINLFATWCPPCKMEFPFMQQVYEEYSDRVALIVISIELNDTPEKLQAYREENDLTLPMAPAGSSWMAMYAQASSIPVSMMIDRFGNLTLRHAGAITDADSFRRMFDAFLGENYTQTRTYSKIPEPVLSLEFPSDEALSQALNADGGAIAFTSDPERHDYPFVPQEQGGQPSVSPSNMDINQSIASVQATISAKEGDALAFDLSCDLEPGSNFLNVEMDGTIIKQFMGRQENRSWAFALPEGAHTIRFIYDQWTAQETGAPFLSRVRLLSGQEAEAALAALPVYPVSDTVDIAVDGSVTGYFTYQGEPVFSGCVVKDDTVDVTIMLSADLDPESMLFVDTSRPDDFLLLSSLLNEEHTAYSYRMNLKEAGDGNRHAFVDLEAFQPRQTFLLAVLQGEEGVQQVIDRYAQQGYALTWEPEEIPEAETEATYTVRVADQNGEPVPGAYLNFCTDTNCQLMQADENGVITFVGEPAVYHLQILRLPEGYSFDANFEAYTEPRSSELTVTVHKN